MDKAVNTLLTKMGVKIEKEKSEEEPAKKGG
jgi:hypothetical protein